MSLVNFGFVMLFLALHGVTGLSRSRAQVDNMKKGVSDAFGNSDNTVGLEPEPEVSYNKVIVDY